MSESFAQHNRNESSEKDGAQLVRSFLDYASDDAVAIYSNEISSPLLSHDEFLHAIARFNALGKEQLSREVELPEVSDAPPILVPPGRRVLVKRNGDGTLTLQGEGIVAMDAAGPEAYDQEREAA